MSGQGDISIRVIPKIPREAAARPLPHTVLVRGGHRP